MRLCASFLTATGLAVLFFAMPSEKEAFAATVLQSGPQLQQTAYDGGKGYRAKGQHRRGGKHYGKRGGRHYNEGYRGGHRKGYRRHHRKGGYGYRHNYPRSRYYGGWGWGYSYGYPSHGYRHRHGYRRSGTADALLGFGLGMAVYGLTQSGNNNDYSDGYDDGFRRATDRYQPAPAPAPQYVPPSAPSTPSGSCLQTREYQTTIAVGGAEQDAYGTACLQPDGSWKLGEPQLVPQY